ncbi:hypothetical protein PaeBR_23065 [Paenibacillus sp. BR2-3]|uniref:hypothetical protein n=1 Tax=Paenibacillus sp. BR2-3 TaxID=3048494 RepID=UPI0039776F65
MTKKAVQMLLVVCFLLLPSGAYVHSAAADSPQVLLLYDSLAKETSKEGDVTVLQQLLAAYSAQVTLVSLDQYERGMMDSYTHVITVINSPDLDINNKSYIEDWEKYQGQYLHIGANLPAKAGLELQAVTKIISGGSMDLNIGSYSAKGIGVQNIPYIASKGVGSQAYGSISFTGRELDVPYAVRKEDYTYAPYLEKGNLSELAMAYVLKDWLPVAATPRTYLVVKEIYPFSDLELLEDLANSLYRSGIPFVVSIRPVFSNTDYPAMDRYLEALKVVQFRNGSILVNAPAVMPTIYIEDHTLQEKMEGFISLLVQNGIAPLGIGAEMYWTYDKEYAGTGMSFFDSAVLFPDEKVIYMEQSHTAATFASSLYSLPLSLLQKMQSPDKAKSGYPLNTAITVDFPKDKQGLAELLQRLDEAWISFADYKQADHQVVTGTDIISSSHGVISINGQELNLQHTPEKVNNDYQYTEEQKKSFTKLFSVQNQFFIVVIILSLLVFGGLFAVGFRLYRQKYMRARK